MELTWPLILWSNAQIPKEHPMMNLYLVELASRRNEDGIWTSIYPNCNAQYTIEAIALLQRHGV
ncbi:hypothetical protein ACFOU2_17260 [Bacillus songklensis]|uniref:Uncharacterized protein n=1 Tax=Bacillus songklensis TaxID=1069116 RepID=A0ABV8B6Z3_9BACI